MNRPLPCLLVVTSALFATTAVAQSRNVALLGSLSPSPSGTYSNIWGYVNPANGKEYAVLGSFDGTHVIDCSNPAMPVQRGLIPSENPGSFLNSWREIKVYGKYAYVVSESYGGIQIIDLTNPDSPSRVGVFGASLWNNSHALGIDEGAGLLYVCGTNNGMHVVDVKTNQTSPTRIYTFGSPYIHDMAAQNGYAYLADIYGNNLLIHDASQLPAMFPLLGSGPMPGSQYAHNAWPTRDDAYCLATNEAGGGPLSIWDVRNKRLPVQIATWRVNTTSVAHNVYEKDRIAHLSYYVEGVRFLDISDPTTPTEVGYYDTYPAPGGQYDGDWGVYHGQPSGIVYVSDIQTGLWVFRPKAVAARHGVTTVGSAGRTPLIYAFGAAWHGNANFGLELEQAAASRPGALLVGVGRATTVFAGVTININMAGAVAIGIVTDAAGKTKVGMPVPNNPGLLGMLNAQFFVADTNGLFDVSATQGLEFEVFAK